MSDPADKGAERETRPHACTKRTWCIELVDHVGPCIEVPREKHTTPNYGPRRA